MRRLVLLLLIGPVAAVACGAVAGRCVEGGANALAAGAFFGLLGWVGLTLWWQSAPTWLGAIRRRKSRVTPAQTRRAFYVAHSWLGGMFGIFLCVVFLTGAVSVYRDELRSWTAPQAVQRGESSGGFEKNARLDAAIQAAARRFPGARRLGVRLASSEGAAMEVLAPGSRGLRHLYYDENSGAFLGEPTSHLSDFLFQLHANLTIKGKLGRYVVGLAGVVWLNLIVSGLWVHRRAFRDLTKIRWARSSRTLFGDLHKGIGVWGLCFHLTLASSGALLGLKDLFLLGPAIATYGSLSSAKRALRHDALAATGEAVPMKSVVAMLLRAEREIPDFEPSLLVLGHWGDKNATLSVGGALPGRLLPKNEAARMEFAAATGQILGVEKGTSSPFFERLYASLAPLHYGDFGGAWLKALYFFWGIACTALTWSGTVLWVQRRSRREPQPVVES